MTTIKTILHATDFSPCADLALQFAGALAKDYGARMVILHVGQPPLGSLGGPVLVPPLPSEWNREELEQQLYQRGVPGLQRDPEYRLEYSERAEEEILRVARDVHADLIVLGTHGRTGVSRLLLGSVAEQVVRKSPCAVLTAKFPLAESSVAAETTSVSAVQSVGVTQ